MTSSSNSASCLRGAAASFLPIIRSAPSVRFPDDRPLPPLYILGSSDYGAKLAARIGVAFAFAGHFSPDPPEPAMRAYRAEFSADGVLDKPHAILALSVFCADTEAAAQRMASSALLSFVQLRSGRPGRMPSPDEAMSHVFTPEEAGDRCFIQEASDRRHARAGARPHRGHRCANRMPTK